MTRPVVLITGAAGFIGGRCAEAFARDGWSVVGLDIRSIEAGGSFSARISDDLSSSDRVARILSDWQPLTILHAAGPASVAQSFISIRDDFHRHTAPWLALLDAVRQASPASRVLLMSSAAVYGEPVSLPIGEEAPTRPISPYGHHKLVQELLLQEFVLFHGLRGAVVRLFSTFGPGMRQLAVWDITRRAMAGEFAIHGTGLETRDYLYVADVCEAILAVCKSSPFSGEAINVASGREVTMLEVASLIFSALKIDSSPRCQFERAQQGNPKRWQADVGKVRALGFQPRTALESAIRDTVAWIREQR